MESNDMDDFCRGCMSVLAATDDPIGAGKHELFETATLTESYVACTALQPEPSDGLPKYLCSTCCHKLQKFQLFRDQCIDSVQRLRELLQQRETLEEKPVIDLKAQTDLELWVDEPILPVLAVISEKEDDEISPKRRRGRGRSKKTTKTKATTKSAIKEEVEAEGDQEEKHKAEENVVKEDKDKTEEDDKAENSSTDANDSSEVKSEEESVVGKRKKRQKRKSSKTSSIEKDTSNRSTGTVFQCDICPTRFFVEHRLIAHKRAHDGLVPYPCPRAGCERSFNRWHSLSEHLKEHAGTNRWFKCEEPGCDKVYKHKPTLAMHMRTFHKRGPELKSHVCEVCGKIFKSSTMLKHHRYTHRAKSDLPYACDQPDCARRFTNKEKLRVHLMRHAGIKNYECPHCGMRKTTRNELNIHINYHTLERTWPCRFCAQVFNSAGNLKTHVRNIHERARDYACRFCERTFAKPDTRKYHEMTHTGEKPSECTECGKRFTQPAALRTHQKIHQRQRQQGQSQDEQQGTSSTAVNDVAAVAGVAADVCADAASSVMLSLPL